MIPPPFSSATTSFCFRLNPGQDLKKELLYYAQVHHLKAAAILCAVGSLKKACLRLADGKQISEFAGPFEIVSLTGTLSNEAMHMHIAIADREGRVLGGHLMEGSEIHTTAEIILLENNDLSFHRQPDPQTGYQELEVRRTFLARDAASK